MKKYTYVIVGNGPAGCTAAQELRKNDAQGSILIVSESEYLSYRRPSLIDYLAGATSLERMLIKPKSFYGDNLIELMLSVSVHEIDPVAQRIKLSTGVSVGFEKLLLASGAHSFVPPIQGIDREGVFTFRWKNDADDIRRYTEKHRNVTVIGGGLLGLETANSLIALGRETRVVEVFPYLLPRQLDTEASAILQKKLTGKGFTFHLDCTLNDVTGTSGVEQIEFKSGETVETNALVISIGIRSNISLPLDAGIQCDKGVLVDDQMMTSADNIYAAGDIARHNGITYGLLKPAMEQARYAARNMAGVPDTYTGTPIEARIKVTGISLFSAGDFNADEGEVTVQNDGDVYKKVVIKGNTLTGAIILGDQSAVNTVSGVYNGRKDLSALEEVIDFNQ